MTQDDDMKVKVHEDAEIQRHMDAYTAAAHAIQTGIGYEQRFGDESREKKDKSLRTGIDMAHVSDSALVSLLIQKGLITRLEHAEALAREALAEKTRLEQSLSARMGSKVTLV